MHGMLNDVISSWGLTLARVREDICITGSPERTDYRAVIEDTNGKLFIVERISPQLVARKNVIAQELQALHDNGFEFAQPYRVSAAGEYILQLNSGYWQVVPYIPGLPLDRPAYVMETWRGKAAADLLILLRKTAVTIPSIKGPSEGFSLPAYIDQLVGVIARRDKRLLPDAGRMHAYVQKHLYPAYAGLPVALCHGDFHAVNTIWWNNRINGLIDWEFSGMKPELYDAANMISCLGIEDPGSLWSGAPVTFVRRLRASGLFSGGSFDHLIDMVIAIRFAWLSEWLRKKDDEMIAMEFDFFDILSVRKADLKACWGIVPSACTDV